MIESVLLVLLCTGVICFYAADLSRAANTVIKRCRDVWEDIKTEEEDVPESTLVASKSAFSVTEGESEAAECYGTRASADNGTCMQTGGARMKMNHEAGMTKSCALMQKKDDPVWSHIKRLLKITIDAGSDKAVTCFAVLSGLLGAVALLTLGGKVSSWLALSSVAVAMAMPYAILRLKLEQKRVESSREGEVLLTELYENYMISYKNMREGIEGAIANMDEAPRCKTLLLNLLRRINRSGRGEDIEAALEEFRASINTSWAGILSTNMCFALTQGMDISNALRDLTDLIVMARKVDEFAKRENNEAGLMLKYLAPASYVMTVLGGLFYFGLSLEEFVRYQFKTSVGLTWLTASVILYILGYMVKSFLSKTKLDI